MNGEFGSHAKDKDMANHGKAHPLSLMSSINDFAQKFYVEYKKSKGDESNLVFSPLSIHVALSMLASGATDNSSTQMELFNVLGNWSNIYELQTHYQDLIQGYNKHNYDRYSRQSKALDLANRVWMTKEEKANVKDTYKDLMKTY